MTFGIATYCTYSGAKLQKFPSLCYSLIALEKGTEKIEIIFCFIKDFWIKRRLENDVLN